MAFKNKIANHPRAAAALIAATFSGCGALGLAILLIPCVGMVSSPLAMLMCMSNYIMKFAALGYPVAIASAFLAVGGTVFFLTNQARSQNPLFVALSAAIGAFISYPVAGLIAVILLRASDDYWRSAQAVWMFNRLVKGSFFVSWPYSVIGAAIAGALASVIVRAAMKGRPTAAA